MKFVSVVLLFSIFIIGLALWADETEATTVCQGGSGPVNANVCQGYGHVSTSTGGVASQRCFVVRTVNTAPTCGSGGITPQNEGWQLDAGQCITFYYFEVTNGAVPPLTPNKFVLSVAIENTGTAPRVYKDGTVPPDASGTSYSFCATSDGTSSGSPRAGTYRIFIRAIKDNAVPSTSNYNINNDGVATVGTLISFDRAALRGQMIVSSIVRNSYPAGSTFAYGTSSDELLQVTSTFTQPNGDLNVETMRNGVVDEATLSVGVAGSTVDVDTTTLIQSFAVDFTFPFANNPYIAAAELVGNSVLTGSKWSVFTTSGHGTCIVRVSDLVVYCDEDIAIDPRIYFDSDGIVAIDNLVVVKLESSLGALTSVFNRGETYYAEWYIFNARNELLSRSMTHTTEDSVDVTCTNHGSLSPSSNKYSVTVVIPTAGSCAVLSTEAGSPRYIMVSNTDQGAESLQVFAVSTLLFVDAHPQDSGILDPDDYPTQDLTETLEYFVRADGSGNDISDHIRPFCKVETVRHTDYDTSGSAISWNIKDPTSTIRTSGVSDSDSTGWTVALADFLVTTPLGTTWTQPCVVTHNGNSGTDTETFIIGVEGEGEIIVEEIKEQGDPLKVFCLYYFLNDSVLCTISESYLDGTARTGNAAGTDVYLYAPDGSLVVNGDSPTEIAFGTYIYEYQNSTEGNWVALIRTLNETGVDIGTSNVFTIDKSLLAHREGSFEFNMNEFLLLLAIAFFVIMGETRKDALYWFFTVILSIYLLINRSEDSIIPIPLYVGWIFITLYQAVSLLMTKRAQNLSSTEE